MEIEARPLGVWNGFVYGYTPDAIYAYDHDGEEPSRASRTQIEGRFELLGRWFTIAEGTLYVRERAGPRETRLGRYDVDNGSVVSTDRTDHRIQSLVVRDGVEYLSTVEQHDGEDEVTFHLMVRENDVLWERSFDVHPGTPVIADETVFLEGDDGELLALDADTGDPPWRRPDSAGMLAIVDETIYAIRPGTVRALR